MAKTAEQKEKIVLFISFFAGLILAVAEFVFAIFTGSQSVLMDSLYDASELIFIVFILFLTPLFHKPISEKRPYGFYQVESIILIIKNFMMLSVTVGVSAEVIASAFEGGNPVDGMKISIFQFFQGIICAIVLFVMNKFNKSLASPTVEAEIMGWKIDIYYSAGLSIAFFGSSFLDNTSLSFLSPYFDPLMVVVIMIITVPDLIKLLIGAIGDVFLFPPDQETIDKIKNICEGEMPKWGFEPTFYDITRTGRRIWASVYFITDDNTVSIKALEYATSEINAIINEELDYCSLELIASPCENFPVEQEKELLEGENYV